jgi:hypothetical protein
LDILVDQNGKVLEILDLKALESKKFSPSFGTEIRFELTNPVSEYQKTKTLEDKVAFIAKRLGVI